MCFGEPLFYSQKMHWFGVCACVRAFVEDFSWNEQVIELIVSKSIHKQNAYNTNLNKYRKETSKPKLWSQQQIYMFC